MTATTRPTATTAPPTTATTTPPTTAGTEPAPAETTPAESGSQSNGQYNGAPYQATEVPADESTTTTLGPGRGGKVPVARSGSSQPGADPSDPSDPANTPNYSSSVPAARSASSTPAGPLPAPVATAESHPSQPAANPATAAGSGGVSSEPATEPAPASEVGGAETERGSAGAAERGGELVFTGDGTRRLMLFGGVAMLLGAVVIAFTGRERQRLVAATLPVGPARNPRPRKEIDGWEDGIPLAPAKRELARNRLGISGDLYYDSYYDDELEA